MCVVVVLMMIVCSLYSRVMPLTTVEISQRKNTESKKILHNALLLNKPQRHARSVTDPRQNCGKWSQWIDDHHPTLQEKGDREFMPPDKIDEFCPSTYGGHISKMMCKDNKGEPAFGNRTDGKIFIFCSDVNHGVTCSMVQQNINGTCPDMAVKYYCNCIPITTAVSKAVQPSTITPGAMPSQSSLTSGLSESIKDPHLHTTLIRLADYSDVSTAVQPLTVIPGVMQQISSQFSSILTSGSTEISTDPRFRTTSSIGLSASSDVSTAVQPLTVIPSVMQHISSQFSPILLSGSTEISTDPRFRTTSSTELSASSGSIDTNDKTENDRSVEERKMTGAEDRNAILQTGMLSVTWWIIFLVISGSLFVVNIVVSVCLYKSAIKKRARQTEVQPI